MTRSIAANIRGLTLAIAMTFLVTSVGVGYWTLVAGDELGSDPFNPRLVAAIRDRPRGFIKDSAGNTLAESVQTPDGYKRVYRDKTLAHVTGYASFKFVTGAAALESGVDPNAKVRVDDPWQADKSWGSYFVRSSSRAHGDYTMADGYRLSENIYFAKIGLQIGGPKLAEYAQRFGIGSSTRCDITGAKGQLSRTGVLDRPTLVADTSYGQGALLVSPLQMALVAAAVGMGGVMPTPHYATEVRDAEGHAIRVIAPGAIGQVIRPETARTLATMLVGAVEGPGAFAFAAK